MGSLYWIAAALTLLGGIAVGWSIGANDAANSLGTAVGARVLTLRQAICLIAVFGFLGAWLQGGHVTKTIGTGIVDLGALDATTAAFVAVAATFASFAWVALATYWKIPISTSHSIVGAVGGAGLALGVAIKWSMITSIFVCWILTPLGAAAASFALYHVFRVVLPRVIPERHSQSTMKALIIVSGCYVAYSWGANDVANATGVLAGARVFPAGVCVGIGGAAIALGVATWGYKVIETIGSEITQLLPLMAFTAQLGSAVNVHVYTLCGIPVSTSHSIVGAICGVGMARGVRAVNLRVMREIVVCWMATPFISGILSYVCMKAIGLLVQF